MSATDGNLKDRAINDILQLLRPGQKIAIDIHPCIITDADGSQHIEYRTSVNEHVGDIQDTLIDINADNLAPTIVDKINGQVDGKQTITLILSLNDAGTIVLNSIGFADKPENLNKCRDNSFIMYTMPGSNDVAADKRPELKSDDFNNLLKIIVDVLDVKDKQRLAKQKEIEAAAALEAQRIAKLAEERKAALAEEERKAALAKEERKAALAEEAAEQAQKLAAEKAEKLAKEAAEKAEKLAKEAAEKLAKEAADEAERQRLLAKEAAEKLAKEAAEKLAKEAAEKLAKEAADEAERQRLLAKEAADEAERQRLLAKEAADLAETQRLAAEKAAEEERIRTAEQARIAEEQAQKAEAEQARIAEAKEAEAKEAAEKEAEAKEADADEDHFGFEAEPYEDEAIREVKEDAKAGQAVILMINPKLHTIYDYLTTIKPGKIRGDEIKNNFMHITQLYNEINDIVDSRKDDKYNINLIRTFQTKYNNNINIDAATDALDELGEALPDYKNMPAELKKTLIISLQDKIYELMRHFGMEKTETPFVNELKKTMIILGSKVNKADNAKLKNKNKNIAI